MNAAPIVLLDGARARMLRALGPTLSPLLRDRELRVAVYASISIAVALMFACAAPLESLVIGPLVLGVPHLVADLRYLVARRGLHKRAAFWAFVALPACASWIVPSATLALVAVLGGALAARGSILRRAPVFAAGAALAIAASAVGPIAGVIVAYAHNAVALGAFAFLSRKGRAPAIALGLTLLGGAIIFSGAIDDLAMASMARAIVESHGIVRTLAPGLAPIAALRLVVFFAFAQSVHYGVWIRLVPEVERDRPGLRSFASSLRALREDIGLAPMLASFAIAVALIAWSVRSLDAARLGYLRLALFHGPLEMGALAMLAIERER